MGNQADRTPSRLTPGRLILVKHGQPQIVPEVPRSQWALSEEGRGAAVALATKLASFEPTALFASTEAKAYDTALAMGSVLALPVQGDAELREHRADHNPFVSPSEIDALIERALRDPDHLVMGEETGASAAARFNAAIERSETIEGGTRVIVAHGRIISFWLSARLGVDPVSIWRKLGVSCGAVLSEDRRSVEIIRA